MTGFNAVDKREEVSHHFTGNRVFFLGEHCRAWTQLLVVDTQLTALGIKDTTQQRQSVLEMKRDYKFLIQL